MLVAPVGSGFEYPQGDPGALNGAAGRLRSAAATLRNAAGSVHSQAAAVTASWCGPAASDFDAAAGSVTSGLNRLAGYHEDSADALEAYARALEDAQKAATAASQAYDRAASGYQTTMANLSAAHPTTPAARSAVSSAENQASNDLQNAFNTASTACTNAVSDANHAASVCAAKLSSIAAEVKDTALHKFLDILAGPGSVLGVLGVATQVQTSGKMWGLLHDMSTGNWKDLAKVNPTAYQKVLEIAREYGPNSGKALAAQLEYEAEIAKDTWGDVIASAVPAGKVPSGAVAGTLDVLGKVGLVTAVVGDVGTLADGQASGLDKGMAAANLGGIGMVAAGTDTAAAILGANAVADWIPGVGEVVVAGTAVYFAQEWVRAHWTDIQHWASDAGHAVVQGLTAVGNFEIHVGSAAVHGLESAGSHVVSGLEDAGSHVVSGVEDAGSHVVSGLEDAGHFVSGLIP